METKVCPKCGREFPATVEYFRVKNGHLSSPCKECNREAMKAWYYSPDNPRGHYASAEVREERKKQRKIRYDKSRESERVRAKEYRETHKEQIKEYRDQHKEERRRYYLDHKEKRKEYDKEYRAKKRREKEELGLAIPCGYKKCLGCGEIFPADLNNFHPRLRDGMYVPSAYCYTCYPGKRKEYTANTAQVRLSNLYKRNLIKLLTENSITMEDWNSICMEFDNSCAYCGKHNVKLTRDHVTAVIYGGANTKSNIVPACKKCNSSKGSIPFSVWYKKQAFYSPEAENKILKHCEEQEI